MQRAGRLKASLRKKATNGVKNEKYSAFDRQQEASFVALVMKAIGGWLCVATTSLD